MAMYLIVKPYGVNDLMTNDPMTIIKEGAAMPGKATAHFFPTFLVRTIKKHKGFRAEHLELGVGMPVGTS